MCDKVVIFFAEPPASRTCPVFPHAGVGKALGDADSFLRVYLFVSFYSLEVPILLPEAQFRLFELLGWNGSDFGDISAPRTSVKLPGLTLEMSRDQSHLIWFQAAWLVNSDY